jgi:hypothetical protein
VLVFEEYVRRELDGLVELLRRERGAGPALPWWARLWRRIGRRGGDVPEVWAVAS